MDILVLAGIELNDKNIYWMNAAGINIELFIRGAMKKYFWKGFLAGFLALAMMRFLYLSPEGEKYRNEPLEIKGYEGLSDEEKERIEFLEGNFQIEEMVIFRSGFDTLWYKEHNDVLVGKEIEFEDIDNIVFCGERYQAVSVETNDADYFWGFRYRCHSYFGKKSVVTLWFLSLDSGNAFALHLPANGSIFFQPGSLSNYGDDPYVLYEPWGMYDVIQS